MRVYCNTILSLSEAMSTVERTLDWKLDVRGLGFVMPLSHCVIEGKSLKLSSLKCPYL